MLLPIFDKRSLFDILTSKENPSTPLSAEWLDGDWFYDIPGGSSYGAINHYGINYTRFWSDMKKHVKWTLSYQSNVGGAWVDASNQMNIITASPVASSQKFTIEFTPLQTGQHKLQLVVDWNALSWQYNNEIKEYWLSYKTGNRNWGFTFNFNDIRNVAGLGFNGYVNSQGQFVFNITRNVPPAGVGRKISLDPSYGLISNAVISSYEWDIEEGRNEYLNGACRVNNSEYYLIAACGDTGADFDGFLRTIHVWNNNGTIQQAVIDIWEYLDADADYCNVKHIPNTDKYIVTFQNATSAKVTLMTVRVWDNNGTIYKTAIDTQALTQNGYECFLYSFTNNIWIVAYSELSSADGFIETVWIDSTGIINNSLLDIEEFDETYGRYSVICNVDSDTIAITYVSDSSTGYDTVKTYNISGAGLITDTPADSWNYEINPWYVGGCYINKIGSTVYDLAWADSGYDINTGTVTIADTGMITKSFIDTLELFNGLGSTMGSLECFIVNNPLNSIGGKGVLGLTYRDASGDGIIRTFNVTTTGTLDAATIDFLEFDNADNVYYAHVEYVNQSYWLITYTSTGSDGWSKTVTINTNWATPTASNPTPANHSSNIALQPTCYVDVNDKDGFSTMDVTFAENSTGSWINRQTNKSCANGNYNWVYSQATEKSHNYYWRVFVNDSMYNMSFTYNFTTLAANIPPTVELNYPIPNGTNHVELNPICAVWANDSNLEAMDITWKNSTDGITWYTQQYNTSVASGTIVRWDSSGIFDTGLTIYYFQVYADDGEANISEWFYFITIGNLAPPAVSNPYPANHSIGIPVTPQMHIAVNDPDGNPMNITWLSNSSTPDTLILRPEANGSSIHLTRSAENANYKCVDETVADDADYVYTTNQVTYINDTYTMQNKTSTNNITSVNVHIRAGYDAIGVNVFITACTAKITLLINGHYYYGSVITLTTSFADYNYVWSTNPNTGLAWIWTDINNMQVGVSLKGRVKATTHSKCSYLYEEVTFINHSNWAVFGRNNSVTNGTYYQTNSNFSDLDETYYWQIHTFDGLHWNNYSYDFTTGAAQQNWNTINDWNGSLYVFVNWNSINDWNGSLYTESIWNTASDWNGSIYINSSWNNINDWNGSLYVSSSWHSVSDWNGSLYFQGAYNQIDDWNGSLYVESNWNTINDWNGSLYVIPSFNSVSDWNGSIYASTIWNNVNDWNGSLYTIYNWIVVNDWNGSLYTTEKGLNITISDPYPANNSINIPINVTLHITINHTSGNLMNITWFWGNSSVNCTHVFGHNHSVANGTYYMPYLNASNMSTTYWWSVNVTDAFGNYTNAIYRFNTTGMLMGLLMHRAGDRALLPLLLSFCGVSPIFFIIFRKRKQKKKTK